MSKSLPYELSVSQTRALTPNMQRITLQGDDLSAFPQGHEGGYIKLVFPMPNENQLPTAEAVEAGAPVQLRTYTVRRFDVAAKTITIDLVLHGKGKHESNGNDEGEQEHGHRHENSGPASNWASTAKVGDSILMYGPGKVKRVHANADWYLLAGDMTALPAISCNLETMAADARGFAVIEVQSEQDKQVLTKPKNIEVIWVINPQPEKENSLLSDAIKALPWSEGKPSIWAACEFSNMRRLRAYFKKEKQVARDELYVSSYWKIGQSEDKHKMTKRLDAKEFEEAK